MSLLTLVNKTVTVQRFTAGSSLGSDTKTWADQFASRVVWMNESSASEPITRGLPDDQVTVSFRFNEDIDILAADRIVIDASLDTQRIFEITGVRKVYRGSSQVWYTKVDAVERGTRNAIAVVP